MENFSDQLTLGQRLLGSIIAIVIIVIGTFAVPAVKELIAKRKLKKMTLQAEAKQKADLALLHDVALEILKSECPDWHDIFKIYDSRNQEYMKKISSKVHLATFIGIIQISRLKEQITWDASFQKALDIMENVAILSFNDTLLQGLTEQLQELCTLVSDCSKFRGYSAFEKEITEGCPTVYRLLSKSVSE